MLINNKKNLIKLISNETNSPTLINCISIKQKRNTNEQVYRYMNSGIYTYIIEFRHDHEKFTLDSISEKKNENIK